MVTTQRNIANVEFLPGQWKSGVPFVKTRNGIERLEASPDYIIGFILK